jgi:hypothetical protein
MMIHRQLVPIALALLMRGASPDGASVAVSGTVRDAGSGRTIPGAVISARDTVAGVSISVRASATGQFVIPKSVWRTHLLVARAPGYNERAVPGGTSPVAIRLSSSSVPLARIPSSRFLEAIKDDSVKRRFILDCAGCHTIDEHITHEDGRPRSQASWAAAITRMVDRYGVNSSFPVISPGRDAGQTADWLTRVLAGVDSRARHDWDVSRPVGDAGRAVVTEYALPEVRDVPNSLALDARGNVVVTGMQSGAMFVLDPATGKFSTLQIPAANANPRDVAVDRDGSWWVLLGEPHQVARRDAASGQWKFFDIGMYGHSLVRDEGGVWFNGLFTGNPPVLGRLTDAGEVQTYAMPVNAARTDTFTTLPYELRRDDDGNIWGSELRGDRLVRFTPATGALRVYPLPMPGSGPRRFDIGKDGKVWIPMFGYGALGKLDPATGNVFHYLLPVSSSAPYVARVNRRTGQVWVATGAADMVFMFDPARARWTEYPLPTRGALVTSMEIDASTGAIWMTYGASPGIAPRVARLVIAR